MILSNLSSKNFEQELGFDWNYLGTPHEEFAKVEAGPSALETVEKRAGSMGIRQYGRERLQPHSKDRQNKRERQLRRQTPAAPGFSGNGHGPLFAGGKRDGGHHYPAE